MENLEQQVREIKERFIKLHKSFEEAYDILDMNDRVQDRRRVSYINNKILILLKNDFNFNSSNSEEYEFLERAKEMDEILEKIK